VTGAQLFAVQAIIALDDYRSADAFAARHRGLAERVAGQRDPALPALAVWPEYVGTFLALAGRARWVRGCATTEQAMRRVALPLLPRILAVKLRYRAARLEAALLAVLAPKVHRIMHDVFSGIARDFDLWVVAGSALLPRNRHGDGSAAYAPLDTRIYNTSYTFAPDGALMGVTRKVNLVPTQEDVLHLSPAPPTSRRSSPAARSSTGSARRSWPSRQRTRGHGMPRGPSTSPASSCCAAGSGSPRASTPSSASSGRCASPSTPSSSARSSRTGSQRPR
jgi:hypothetical protein